MDFLDVMHYNLTSINTTFQKYGVKILKHENFVTAVDEEDCMYILSVESEDRCEFVHEMPSCTEDMHMINYMDMFFCKMTENDTAKIYGLCFGMLLLTAYLFIIMTLAAEFIFCPGLLVMAKLFHMSESVAGVTILAFGNSADNILGAIVNYSEDMTMINTEILGGAIFISCVVAACICIIRPFYVIVGSFIRDIIFYLIAVYWIFNIMYDEYVELWEAISLLTIYVIYITIVISSQVYANYKLPYAQNDIFKTIRTLKLPGAHIRGKSIITLEDSRLRLSPQAPAAEDEETEYPENIFADFLHYMRPFTLEEFHAVKLRHKIWAITKTPAVILLRFFVPVVDYDCPRHGWCKLLNSVQCITSPLYVSCLLSIHDTIAFYILSFEVQIWMIILVIGWIPMTILLFKTSVKTNPKVHDYLVFASFIVSISTINFISQEIVAIIATLGKVFYLSNNFLGLTALAWGKGIGELFANISVAQQGLSMMAFSACFGGPLLTIVLGAGVGFLIKAIYAEDYIANARPGTLGKNCVTFLCYSLLSTLAMISLTRFQVRPSHGIFLIIFYLTFLLFCILGELTIIHPYGTDHNPDPAESLQDIIIDIP